MSTVEIKDCNFEAHIHDLMNNVESDGSGTVIKLMSENFPRALLSACAAWLMIFHGKGDPDEVLMVTYGSAMQALVLSLFRENGDINNDGVKAFHDMFHAVESAVDMGRKIKETTRNEQHKS